MDYPKPEIQNLHFKFKPQSKTTSEPTYTPQIQTYRKDEI